jgi:polyisoprenoid-binding protein YceI
MDTGPSVGRVLALHLFMPLSSSLKDNYMRTFRAIGVLAAAGLALIVAFAPAAAQHILMFTAASRVAIDGSSNLSRWTCESDVVGGAVAFPESGTAEVGKAVTALSVDVPVNSLDCGHGEMNENLRKAMHEDVHPAIRFRMTSYASTPHAGAYDAIIKGVLTINGVARPVEMRARVTPNDSGGAGVIGSTSLNTEDYGVKRIRLLMGALRTSAAVVVTFRLVARRT